LAGFAEIAGHLCGPQGSLLAMKGIYPDEEIEQLPSKIKLDRVERIDVPGVRAARHLVIMRPRTNSQ
jgi:16S rRNA (guanine527-N7)-methyltransferase